MRPNFQFYIMYTIPSLKFEVMRYIRRTEGELP